MKKNLLTFGILMLCIGIFSAKTFAQEIPGGGGDGMGDILSLDAGISISAPIIINPPSYVSNVKRNNGNGTTTGSAETRLAFSDKKDHLVTLLAITNLDGSPLPLGSVNLAADRQGEFISKGYRSYALIFNIPPKGKLLFHFSCDGNNFCIPETN